MRKRLKNGFSTAELLIVVAIIVLLGMIGTVSTVSYLRTMHQLEMNGVAKEIFLAAQNHLSAAGSESYLERAEFGTPEEESVNGETGVYYYITGASGGADPDSDSNTLGLMLPFGSVDETVRKGGSYIVRYHRDSAQVLDVFYSNAEGQRYGHNYTAAEYATLIQNYRADTRACSESRRNYSGAVLGYYGGVEAADFQYSDTFTEPTVEVVNAEKLYVNVTNTNEITKSGFTLRLVVTGKTSGASKYLTLVDSGSVEAKYSTDDSAGGAFTVVLDDITDNKGHFAQLFGSDTSSETSGWIGGALIPGEDVEIKAVAFSNALHAAPATSVRHTANSLFSNLSNVAAGEATVANARHLENLSAAVSALGLNNTAGSEVVLTSAKQSGDISWPEFKSAISSGSPDGVSVYGVNGNAAAPAGKFSPITFDGALDYDGDGKSISGVSVSASANAGLFAVINGGGVKALELKDFDIATSNGAAGALAGAVSDAMITGVVAHNDNLADDSALSVRGSGAAGGLIGSASGTTVSASAAAVYVKSTGGAAGGLIGSMAESSYVVNSYSGGHTVDGMYSDDDSDGAKGRVNVIGVTAGGLVGDMQSSSLSCSYSTSSAKGENAGGLIGAGSGVTVSGSYSTGKVLGSGGTPVVGAFMGAVSSVTSSSGNKYFEIINEGMAAVGSGTYAEGLSELDDTLATYNENIVTDTAAFAYDPYLVFEFKGVSDMTGIAGLHGGAVNTDEWPEFFKNSAGTESVHYGDWPSPETKVVNPDSLIATVSNRSFKNFGAVRLDYDASAAIPDGAKLSVSPLDDVSGYEKAAAELAEGSAAFADISIISGGEEIEPSAPVKVSMQLPAGAKDVSVIHFGDEPELMDVTVEGNVATFETRSFSVYAVVGGQPARRTYAFYSPDQNGNYSPYDFYTSDGEWVNEQIIKTGEPLIIPQLPSIEGSDTSTFAGWYEYDEATDTYAENPYDFNNVPAVTADERVILRAKFANYAYVIFHEQYNGATSSWPVTATRRGEMSGTPGTASIRIDDVTVTYDDESQSEENSAPEMAFRGWSRTKVTAGASTDQNGNPIVLQSSPLAVSGNTDLYPVFVHINWLNYISGVAGSGSTYIPPKSYYVDEGETTFKVPTRTGYVFDGWYTGEPVYVTETGTDGKPVRKMTGINYGTQITNGSGQLVLTGSIAADGYVESGDLYVQGGKLMLNDDVTLYGKWHEGTANYTIVIKRQKVEDSKNATDSEKTYDFAESVTLTATTGSTVSVPDVYKQRSGGDYTCFHYNRCDGAKTVAGNGSTVLEVFYDRDLMIISFDRAVTGGASVSAYTPTTATTGTQYGLINGQYVQLTRDVSGSTSKYVRTTTLSAGGEYLIVNINAAGNGYALSHNGASIERAAVTVYNDNGSLCIDPDGVDATAVWTTSSGIRFQNGGYYLRNSSNNLALSTTTSSNWSWNGSNNRLSSGRYLRYTNNAFSLSNNQSSIYLYQLTTVNEYGYFYNGQPYTGTRYTPSSTINNAWTGLYQQTFEQNGYDWDNVTNYAWSNGSTTQTMLIGFNETDNPYTLTRGNSISGNNYIYHYQEQADGKYDADKHYNARTNNTSGTFNFSNKFTGFDVVSYSTNTEGFQQNGGSHPVAPGNSVSATYPLYVYHERHKYTLTFVDSNTNAVIGTKQVPYGLPLEDYKIADPDSYAPEGYSFKGWYYDKSGSYASVVNFSDRTMPAANLIVYACWETEWYLIEIDPNGGQLHEGNSTWFWEGYNGDPIEEYTQTRRDYIESLDGTYYYHLYDREHYGLDKEWNDVEDDISERNAYYTTDMEDATDLSTAYEYSKDAFRYAGWFEVHEDGSETLYKFGEPVMHDTFIRLHWKQVGTYYIKYDAAEGTMDSADSNEETFKLLDSADYSDHSDVVVTRTAYAPQGKNFIGWYIRGDESETLYYPGQNFEFQSKYAITETDPETGKEKKYLYMVAKYSEIAAAQITYDANGGSISGTVDYGAPTDPEAPETIRSQDGTTATIAHLVSNSEIRLSSGNGFTNNSDLLFTGWNTKPDATGEHFDANGIYCVDSREPVTLYAEWQVRVYFDKNNAKATWGEPWDEPTYYWDETRQQYYTLTYVNRAVPEPPAVPVSSDIMERFAYWSPVRYTDSSDIAYEFDFSTPITETTTLFGFWANAIQVDYYLVDHSGETPVDRSDEWRTEPGYFLVNTGTNIPLNESTTGYWNVPSDYKFAMVSLAETMNDISDSNVITNIGYNTVGKCVNVTYANGTVQDLPSTLKVYVVFYKDPVTVPIGYVRMDSDGALSNVTVNAAAPKSTDVTSTPYDMTGAVTAPLAWANNANFKYYAFALGEKNATDAGGLRLITASKNTDGNRPLMQIRNTWKGVEYSTDGGTTWTMYGSDVQLYVVYFESQPTIVTVNEVTHGTEADENEQFTYNVQVIETTTTTVQNQTRTVSSGWNRPSDEDMNAEDWSNVGSATTNTGETSNITTTFELSNGQSQSRTLFYTDSQSEELTNDETTESGWIIKTYTRTQTRTLTTVTVTQKIIVIQVPKDEFTTDNASDRGTKESAYKWYYTTTPGVASAQVTYTNRRTQMEVLLHVAESAGGGLRLRDDMRISDESVYTLTIPIDGTVNVAQNDPANLFVGDTGVFNFADIISGAASGDSVTMTGGGVSSVTFGKLDGSDYYGIYVNGDPAADLGSDELFFVYYRMPKVYYVKEGSNGALTMLSDPLQRNGAAVHLNDVDVVQSYMLNIPSSGLTISQTDAGAWRVPRDLDGDKPLSLLYSRLAAGVDGVTNLSDMDFVSEDNWLSLHVSDGQVKFRRTADAAPENFSGVPAVYVVYKEKGYDLTISKTVEGDDTGAEFTVTLSSKAITETGYTISGYTVDGAAVTTIGATPAVGDTPGTIVLKLKHGDSVRIDALQKGSYIIRETLDPDEYKLSSAKVDGYAVTVTDDCYFTLTLDNDKAAALTNTPGTKDFEFVKLDGFGAPLSGVTFTLYSNVQCTAQVKFAVSDANGRVSFPKLKRGIYYMKETVPDGYETDVSIYKVSVTLTGCKLTPLNDTTKELTSIINLSAPKRKVILKKLSQKYDPLPGAKFTLYRVDMTPVATGLTSSDNGAFFIGSLPYGVYYVEETTPPTGYNAPAAGMFFRIEVTASGAQAGALAAIS